MKKLKNMKKRDEKVESLLMEKWGYSAPILHEGPKEDGDKELLTEGLAIGAILAVLGYIAVIVGGAWAAYEGPYKDYKAGLNQDELMEIVPGETGEEKRRNLMSLGEEFKQRIENFTFPGQKKGESYTWENAILDGPASQEAKDNLEIFMRNNMKEEEFNQIMADLDGAHKGKDGFKDLVSRGRAPVDPDTHAQALEYEELGMFDEQSFPELQDALAEKDRVDALMASRGGYDESFEADMMRSLKGEDTLADLIARRGASYEPTYQRPPPAPILDQEEYRPPNRNDEGYDADYDWEDSEDPDNWNVVRIEEPGKDKLAPRQREKNISRKGHREVEGMPESRVPKSTKDIIREEINKYFSNRRKS